MSEMMISARTAAQKMETDVRLWTLGRENEKLNEGLRAMALSNAVLTQECDELRRALDETRARLEAKAGECDELRATNRRYQAMHNRAYERGIAEQCRGNRSRRLRGWISAVKITAGVALGLGMAILIIGMTAM